MPTASAPAPSRKNLAAALSADRRYGRVAAADLSELPRSGLAHRHWRVRGRGVLLRVPLFDDAVAIAREVETFRRAAPSAHTPLLHGVLAPTPGLPGGAMIVDAVRGRSPRLPQDLPAIAQALAAIHELPVPPPAARAPLSAPEEPFAATLAVIERHLAASAPSLTAGMRSVIDAELAWARDYAGRHATELRRGPRSLVLTDTHPRNFIRRADGAAIAVDLEKALYGAPAIDLAHAVLPASIAWGRRGERVGATDRRRFLAAYFKHRTPSAEAALRPFLAPMLRLTWLRTTAAFAAFRASGADRVMGPAARALARRAIAAALDPKAMVAAHQLWTD
jgi:hypothetical protein